MPHNLPATPGHRLASSQGRQRWNASGHQSKARALFQGLITLANKEATNEDGLNPVFATTRENHLDVLELLLRAGADKDAASRDGITPLMFATGECRLEVLTTLLHAGAQINRQGS